MAKCTFVPVAEEAFMEESAARYRAVCPALAHKHDQQLFASVLFSNECQGFHMPHDILETIVGQRTLEDLIMFADVRHELPRMRKIATVHLLSRARSICCSRP